MGRMDATCLDQNPAMVLSGGWESPAYGGHLEPASGERFHPGDPLVSTADTVP